jgi:hypothetical protein
MLHSPRRMVFVRTSTMRPQCTGTDPVRLAENDVLKCLWMSPDVSVMQSPFNAGAFLVRGTVSGRRLIADWCALYDPNMWTTTHAGPPASTDHDTVRTGLQKQSNAAPRRWKNTVGSWAGEAFEQGSFVKHLWPRANQYGVQALPYYVFNEVDCTHPHNDSVCVHLHGVYVVRPCGPEQCVTGPPSACIFGTTKKSCPRIGYLPMGQGWVPLLLVSLVLVAVTVIVKRSYH